MKNKMNLVLSVVAMLILFIGCQKDKSSANYTVLDTEKSNVKSALDHSQAYNDTLILVYDTAKIHKNNKYCMHYDSLYHKNDSLFGTHYNMFCDEIYKNGMMMSNYSPSASMMQGGMMNGGTMDRNKMMSDTAIVGGYYRNMQQLHTKHATYHNGIYN